MHGGFELELTHRLYLAILALIKVQDRKIEANKYLVNIILKTK